MDEVLLEELPDAPCPSLPKPEYIARAANRLRQRLRPKDPTDLEFELDDSHIPDHFLLSDIQVRGRRHLMFATDQQLQHLARAKTWYVDGTFKLCRHPFNQLLTVNAFVKHDDHAKQVPLLFVIMSGRKKRDYKKVFKKVIQILPTDPAVKRITLDFEKAVWKVFRSLLPHVKLQGCVFHWTQALWRKVRIHESHITHHTSYPKGPTPISLLSDSLIFCLFLLLLFTRCRRWDFKPVTTTIEERIPMYER